MVTRNQRQERSNIHCTLCGPRHGIVYLCDACRQRELASLHPAGRGCACNPDTLR